MELYRRGLPVPIDMNGQRYGGFLSHPNQYGIVTSSSAVMLAVFIFSRNRLRSLIGLAMIGIYGVCLFQSLSKTNIVLIVISGLASAFLISLPDLTLAGRRIFFTFAALVLLVIAGAFAVKILEEVSPREAKTITNAIFDPGGTKSLDDREGVWDEVTEILRRRPVTGLGPGLSDATLSHHHAHNLFLQHWIDAGISGFIGIWLITLAVFWRAFELAIRAMRSPGRLSEDASIRVLAGLALVMSILGNSMSASLTTAVMTAFVIFVGIAFVRESDPTMP
ncbi:MAG: O-antigen ligase family protein [Chthoniobacter sp.]|nr:O-antigen ligase family protein [Chthoniobacter sp.]